MVRVGLAVRLEAKPGKEAEVATFLKSGLALANQEPNAFPDDSGRKAHLTGPIAATLMAKAGDLLSSPPKIENVDVLASKVPGG